MQENTCAALLARDVLMGKGTALPSHKDRAPRADYIGRQTLGIMCHNILPQVVQAGMPSWDDGLPDLAGNDLEDAEREDFRKTMRRKAYRAKLRLGEPSHSPSLASDQLDDGAC